MTAQELSFARREVAVTALAADRPLLSPDARLQRSAVCRRTRSDLFVHPVGQPPRV